MNKEPKATAVFKLINSSRDSRVNTVSRRLLHRTVDGPGRNMLDGTLSLGIPLCVVKDAMTGAKEIVELGNMTTNHHSMDAVKRYQAGGGVAVKFEHAVYQNTKIFGRQFDDKDELYSRITTRRQSIDVLKEKLRRMLVIMSSC